MFEGKVALVTGGASGIGRAIARLVASEGGALAVADISRESGEIVVAEIVAAGGKALYLDCDVTDHRAIKLMVAETVERFGRLDCAFNNAGVALPADGEWDDGAFQKTFDINVTGIMQCMKAEIPEMLKGGGGTIVNTASTAGFVASGSPSMPGYVASKHAIIGLTKTAALTYARQNIRVNAICPGTTLTGMVEWVLELGPEVRASLENASPMGRLGRPEEMAEAAIWLASAKSSFVTGHALVVDGGLVIQ